MQNAPSYGRPSSNATWMSGYDVVHCAVIKVSECRDSVDGCMHDVLEMTRVIGVACWLISLSASGSSYNNIKQYLYKYIIFMIISKTIISQPTRPLTPFNGSTR